MYQQLQLLPLLMCLLLGLSLSAQTCPQATPTNGVLLAGNNYTAYFKADGSPLWHADTEVYEGLEYDDPISGYITTIFAQGIWLAGRNAQDNLLVSAATYSSTGFVPGPLGEDGQVAADNCADFDRAWNVRRYDIEAHLADYADNQIIDNPISSVMGWPGGGNPDFFTYNGFNFPDATTASAPYFDANNDGQYTPAQGDYPVEPKHLSIAEHLVWTVSNTLTPASSTILPFPTQLETTAWAFQCTDNERLNDAIFTRYKITNLSGENFSDVRFGLWTDFDLGCYTDDYIGIDTASQSVYVYNIDNFDNDPCVQGVQGTGENPPVQSITFLNQGIDAFIHIQNAFIGNPPPATTDPSTAVEFNNFLNARWRDGRPIQAGGTGYDQGANVPETNYVFPGNPNSPNSWSMNNVTFPISDTRTLAVTNINDYLPGDVFSLDVAYAYHREEGVNHLGNVNVMIENVAEIQSLYDVNWDNNCAPVTCDDGADCIFPGDLNADGIANYVDLVALSFGWGETGPERNGPHTWAPRSGTNWDAAQAVGPNQKHLDGNGDGIIDERDYEKTEEHYNLIRTGYSPTVESNEGPELQFIIGSLSSPTTSLEPGQIRTSRVYVTSNVPNLQAVSYQIEYDPAFFSRFNPSSPQTVSSEDFDYARSSSENLYECVTVRKDPNFPLNDPEIAMRFSLRAMSNFPDDFPTTPTEIRIVNARGWLADGTEIALGGMSTTLDITGITTSVNEPSWANEVNFYPNPASNFLQLELNDAPVEQIEVINTVGQVNRRADGNVNRIDLSNLPAGTYFLRISGREGVVSRKFVKK